MENFTLFDSLKSLKPRIIIFLNDNGNTVRKIFAIFFLILAILSFAKTKVKSDQTPVWMSNKYISPGNILKKSDFRQISIDKKLIPNNSIINLNDWLNQYNTNGIEENSILTKSCLLDSYTKYSQEYVQPETKIMPLELTNENMRNLLNPGQKINIFASIQDSNNQKENLKIFNATVVYVEKKSNSLTNNSETSPILVQIHEEKALEFAKITLNNKITISFTN